MLKDYQVVQELRELSQSIPEEETVLLPDCKPSEFYVSTKEVEFVEVELSRLLYFIADMLSGGEGE